MIVIDASALIDLVTRRDNWQQVRRQLEQAGEVAAPDLIFVEVASALARLSRAGELSDAEAAEAVSTVHRMPLSAYPLQNLLPAAWGMRQFVRVADAFYLACAQRLDTSLLTTDTRLARAHHGIPVITC